MRFIDLSVAALVATSAITGIFAWDPQVADASSRRLHLEIRLRDNLLSLLNQRGIDSLLRSVPDACAYFASKSNSSFGIAMSSGTIKCGVPPAHGSAVATLSMKLPPGEVTIEEWSVG